MRVATSGSLFAFFVLNIRHLSRLGKIEPNKFYLKCCRSQVGGAGRELSNAKDEHERGGWGRRGPAGCKYMKNSEGLSREQIRDLRRKTGYQPPARGDPLPKISRSIVRNSPRMPNCNSM